MGKLGTGINANLNNAAATNTTRIASANNGNTNYFSFDVNTLATLLTTLFTGLNVTKNANSSAQINLQNSNPGANAKAQFYATTEGNADATFGTIFNGGISVLFGLRASDGKFVFGKNTTLANGVLATFDQNGAWTFADVLNTIRGLLNGVNPQTGTTYTLGGSTPTFADSFKKTLCSNASGCAVTFNDGSAAIGDEGIIQRANGAGNITLVAGLGVTINSSPYQSLVIAAPNGRVGWWKSATNTYYVSGDLTS